MLKAHHPLLATALSLALAAYGGAALAQAPSKGGKKIVCWKDKDGKVVGCGDSVPPEYQDSATKEIDKRGITRKETDTAEARAKQAADEKKSEAQKAEAAKLAAEQRRHDQALLNTFSNEKEIDLKRDRDLQVVDGQLTQLRVTHKNAADRQHDVQTRIDQTKKTGKPATAQQSEDLTRAQSDMEKAEQAMAGKEKEKDDIRKRYADMKDRYMKLRSGEVRSPAAAEAAPPKAAKK